MRVLFINNDGGGFADHIDIADGTTVQQLFDQRLPQRKPADYLIRVNRQPSSGDAVLQPGDRISITPTKIEGAATRQRPLTPPQKGHPWELDNSSTVCTHSSPWSSPR